LKNNTLNSQRSNQGTVSKPLRGHTFHLPPCRGGFSIQLGYGDSEKKKALIFKTDLIFFFNEAYKKGWQCPERKEHLSWLNQA
jgi:hypothetical protein